MNELTIAEQRNLPPANWPFFGTGLATSGVRYTRDLLPAEVGAAPVEGKWRNPKNSVIVRVAPCGAGAWCGTVNIIGSRLLTGLKPAGGGAYQGRVYLPKHRIAVNAIVRSEGANSMVVRGCAVAGVLCKEQHWTQVS